MEIKFAQSGCLSILKAIRRIDNDAEPKGEPLDIGEEEAYKYGEARYQISEGFRYEYKISEGYHFSDSVANKIVNRSAFERDHGIIEPNIFVGTHFLEITDSDNASKYIVPIEVISVKAEYRKDYRIMLNQIAKQATELILEFGAPQQQSLGTDFNREAKLLYQQFCLVKSFVEIPLFEECINRIINIPVTGWNAEDIQVDSRRMKGLNIRNIREIASSPNRLPIWNKTLATIPLKLTQTFKKETTDIPANRIIKHILLDLQSFCYGCYDAFKRKDEKNNMADEARKIAEKLDVILSTSFFRALSPPVSLHFNNTVLQRKYGYREIMEMWVRYKLAANLKWEGGEDVFLAGKKDVATLYEYWVYFELLTILRKVFDFNENDIKNIFELKEENNSIVLKRGKKTSLIGRYVTGNQSFKVDFSYNRVFGGKKQYPSGGSYTLPFRPDYTLTIWPDEFEQYEAEERELITHLHFDAKYKIENLQSWVGNDALETEEEIVQQHLEYEKQTGKFKNADLIKMHAYKDAIRRTSGAYILYPGTEKYYQRGFHEIIPGLGAFSLRPEENSTGSDELEKFIREFVNHFITINSQHRFAAAKTFEIYKDSPPEKPVVNEIPFYFNKGKEIRLIPQETFVIVGYSKSAEHFSWIQKNMLYNFRDTNEQAALYTTKEFVGARYLLLRKSGLEAAQDLYKITDDGLMVKTRDELLELKYPSPGHPSYFVINIQEADPEFEGLKWHFKKLREFEVITQGKNIYKKTGTPFVTTLSNLLSVAERK